MTIRVLLLADTHLGFDFPLRPRVERARRGPDFFANTRQALEPARRGEVDLVVHGGDLLYRSKVPARLVEMALEPLLETADLEVPVILVPGNHERSSVPFPVLAAHRHLHVLDRPRTVRLIIRGTTVAVSGFPCERYLIRDRFNDLVDSTGWKQTDAGIRLLCLHQTVEGSRVGPAGYTFRTGADIIPGRALPPGFAAVLAGHIHRHQVLTADLTGRPLPAPVLYPGSVERTSIAERREPKGYLTLELDPNPATGGRISSWRFHRLPSRPMVDLDITHLDLESDPPNALLQRRFADLDPRSIVRIRVPDHLPPVWVDTLRAHDLRSLAPRNMIVDVRFRRKNHS